MDFGVKSGDADPVVWKKSNQIDFGKKRIGVIRDFEFVKTCPSHIRALEEAC